MLSEQRHIVAHPSDPEGTKLREISSDQALGEAFDFFEMRGRYDINALFFQMIQRSKIEGQTADDEALFISFGPDYFTRHAMNTSQVESNGTFENSSTRRTEVK